MWRINYYCIRLVIRQIRKIIIVTCNCLREREVFDQNAHKTTNSFISNGQSDTETDRTHSGLSLTAKNSRSCQTDASFCTRHKKGY